MLLYIVIKMLTALAYLAEQTFTSFNMHSVYTETKGIHQRERERKENHLFIRWLHVFINSLQPVTFALSLHYKNTHVRLACCNHAFPLALFPTHVKEALQVLKIVDRGLLNQQSQCCHFVCQCARGQDCLNPFGFRFLGVLSFYVNQYINVLHFS